MEALNRELEAFTYSVSHDLRAPLRAVNGYAKLLYEDYSNVLDDDAKSFVEIIRSNATNMGHLIDQLLRFSKLGRKRLEMSSVDVSEMVRKIKSEIDTMTPHSAEIEIGKLPSVTADNVLMHQVFLNLISNAIKYSSKKENPRILVTSEDKETEIVFSVKDNGVGFDMRHVDKLFEVFNRLHTNDEFEGVGVGLAIVKRIIEKFDGRVWAEGRLNEGATFCFAINKS